MFDVLFLAIPHSFSLISDILTFKFPFVNLTSMAKKSFFFKMTSFCLIDILHSIFNANLF